MPADLSFMRVLLLAIIAAATFLEAQTPPASRPEDGIRAAMEATVEKQRAAAASTMGDAIDRQRASIRSQAAAVLVEIAEDETSTFLAIPWPKPAVLEASMALCDPLSKAEVDSLVALNSKRERLTPDLLREVMRRESGFRPCATSRAGAQGLMQLMPATVDQFRVRDPLNPDENVAAGAKFLRSLLDRYGGNIALALGAYNAGPGRVAEDSGVPDIPETQNYVGTILKTLVIDYGSVPVTVSGNSDRPSPH
jgi:soluble lytic murein transglycosylase-like protein